MPQSDLVLLLVWVQDKANVYTGATNTDACATSGDTDVTTLSSTTHAHTGTFTLSSTTYVHAPNLAEQLAHHIPERNASQGSAFACPKAGVCLLN